LNLEVGNQTLYMSGSINGLYIEGADNGNPTERDYRLWQRMYVKIKGGKRRECD
jgi:hypothetical protein